MPQLFLVLRCYKCNTFQVQQQKKSTKWACKICCEKQSVKHIYGSGSGFECRKHVQRLNLLKGEAECLQANSEASNMDNYIDDYVDNEQKNEDNLVKPKTNTTEKQSTRWDKYLDPKDDSNLNECQTGSRKKLTNARIYFDNDQNKEKSADIIKLGSDTEAHPFKLETDFDFDLF